MNRAFKRIGLTVAATAALSILVPVSSASALGRTDCGSRTDFLKVTNYGGSGVLCFANAGSRNVLIYQVDKIEAGNNRVQVTLGGRNYTIEKNQALVDVGGAVDSTLTYIKIY
ncbi:beta/gamma crystallin domain-containing protein [Streptomyces sp. NPDC002181]|uniref:beta/gamma crystallin domain-containing protein n=1 Tax=Streptomyces sp. NPDC002181 TaxID=3364635 RepID=UPI003690E6EC